MADNDIFVDAHLAFLESIPPDERTIFSTCASADQLLADARKLEVVLKERSRGRRFIGRIKALTDGLASYFEVINILVSSHPEYAAPVWGSIRLVLQLASNYAGFFDKLTRTLERISSYLPQYHLIVTLYKGDYRDQFTSRIRTSLGEVYVDVFRFLQELARVFTKRDGSHRLRPVVMTKLAWKSFDARFDDILDRMAFHRVTLKDVIDYDQMRANMAERELAENARQLQEHKGQISQTEIEEERKKTEISRLKDVKERFAQAEERRFAAEAREKAENAHADVSQLRKESERIEKDKLILRIRNWLFPPEFLKEYQKSLHSREEGTTAWLLEEPLFTNWKLSNLIRSSPKKFEQDCLWVQGNPGCGKTVLAAAAIEELKYHAEFDCPAKSSEVFHFFFRSGILTMNSTAAANRAILSQILQNHQDDEDLLDKFSFAMSQASGGQLTASEDELAEMLRVYTRSCGRRCYIVLDGMDECEENATLVGHLLQLGKDSDVKFLLFSRPNVEPLSWTVPEEHQFPIGRKTSDDIGVFLMRKVERLKDEGKLPQRADTAELAGHLLTGADGMFLWARLMISFLNSPAHSRASRIEIIENVILPEGLETMYNRISNLIEQGYQAERHLATKIITWLTGTERRLDVRELRAAIISSSKPNTSLNEVDSVEEFVQSVIMTCGGLVEVEEMYSPVHQGVSRFFRFIHLSVSEYFSTGESPLSLTAWECRLEVTYTCLNFLTFNLPANPLGGSVGRNTTRKELDKSWPFCSYAALYWYQHLVATELDSSRTAKDHDSTAQNQLEPVLLALSRFLSQKFVLMSWVEASYILGQPPSNGVLNQLSRRAASIGTFLHTESIDTAEIHDDLTELCRFMKEVHQYWGSKLMESPALVWEEVTAFTPSRLFPQTSAIKVQSLVSDEPDSDYLSTKCLCKVSVSSLNGLLVGVLSVWPSRDFEDFIQKSNRYFSLEILHELSLRWIARYEVWSLVSEPVRIIDHRFPLDRKEVFLQMKQTMCQKRDFGEGWGMQFPMAISKNVYHFLVLRTLYRLKPADSGPGIMIQSTTLSMNFNGTISSHWCPDPKGVASDELFRANYLNAEKRFDRRDLYLYWIFFCPDECSILFVSQDFHTQSMAAIFRIEDTPKLTAPIVHADELNVTSNLIRHPEWCRDFNQVQVIHHPIYPLLGFSFAGLLYLWAFKNPQEKPRVLCNIHPDPKIEFSSCGKYITYSETSEGRRIVRPIPHTFLQYQQLSFKPEALAEGYSNTSLTRSKAWVSPELGRSSLPVGSYKPRGHDGQVLLSTSPSRQNNVVAKRWDKTLGIERSKDIIKLPSWAGIGKVDVDARMPNEPDEMIKIVLNRAAQPWYGMSEPENAHLPAFVERDPKSLDLSNFAIEERPEEDATIPYGTISSENPLNPCK